MCGINGFTFADKKLIVNMNRCIKHRGPDDAGTYVNDHISLGSQRLSIIDLSPLGHMPMTTADKRFWIVYNGEVYNFKSLRNILIGKGYSFKSGTDTEVILNGYQEYGDNIFVKLNGMFALAIWDNKLKKLVLARDRIGIKPIYYTTHKNHLIFSSEIKALHQHQLPKDIDPNTLSFFFKLQYIPSPKTIYKNIFKLPPAHFLVWHQGQLNINRYWNPKSVRIQKHPDLRTQIKDTLSSAVKDSLISDRPVGLFLSGGIDSSLLLSLITNLTRTKVKTFSAGFKVKIEEKKYNQDFYRARSSSKYFNSDHHEIMVSASDVTDNLQKITYHLDEPITNATQLATYPLSRFASQHITVSLSGDGGDELFGGYSRYLDLYRVYLYQKLPQFIANTLPKFIHLFKPGIADLLEKAAERNSVTIQTRLMTQYDSDVSKILQPGFFDPQSIPNYFWEFFLDNNKIFPAEHLLADLSTWLPDDCLIRNDKLTMANSLEQRVPYLDNRVVDLALSIPFHQKLTPFQTKTLLREVASDWLPDFIITAPKWGWTSPISKWLRDELSDFAWDTLNSAKDIEFLNIPYIESLLSAHQKGKYFPQLIWTCLVFINWYQTIFRPSSNSG